MSDAMDRKIARPAWRSRRAMIAGAAAVGVVLLVVIAAMIAGGAKRTLRVERSTVTIQAADNGVFHNFSVLHGRVTPHDVIDLDALEGGQVRRILVQEGDRVSVGQPLLEFRNTQLELEVLTQQAQLIQGMSGLQQTENSLENNRLANQTTSANIDYNITRLSRSAKRRDPLVTKGFLSPETADQIHDELDNDMRLKALQAESNARQDKLRETQLPQIHASMDSITQSLKVTKAKLEDLTVRAPIGGTLTDFNHNIGQNKNRGERLGEIVADTGYKVAATVDEYYLGRVLKGQIADIDIGGKTYALRVERVYPAVKNGQFTIDLDFVGRQPAGLSPGQSVDGRLGLGSDQRALILPAGAFLDRSGGDWVMVMTGDRRAERRPIKIGRRNAEQVEILSGLSPGDRVITSDYSAFEKIDRVVLKQ
jgi:HlyD family secretion protein